MCKQRMSSVMCFLSGKRTVSIKRIMKSEELGFSFSFLKKYKRLSFLRLWSKNSGAKAVVLQSLRCIFWCMVQILGWQPSIVGSSLAGNFLYKFLHFSIICDWFNKVSSCSFLIKVYILSFKYSIEYLIICYNVIKWFLN